MAEARILQRAAFLAFTNCENLDDVTFQKNEDHNAVSTAVNVNGSLINVTVRIYHPNVFYRIRKKLKITNDEVLDEVQHGDFQVSEKAGLFDEGNFYSDRERLMMHGLTKDEGDNFVANFATYSQHVLGQKASLLAPNLAFIKIETSAKLKIKSPFFEIQRSIFPRQSHDYMFFLDLKGSVQRKPPRDGEFLNDTDLTWEHEISFPQEERNKVLTALHEDVQFLESINSTNYSLVVAITQRKIETSLQLPGKPYGPDENEDEQEERKKTLPIRHDIANGAKAIRADLIPKPRFSDEHPDWEYYFGLVNTLTPFKTKAKIARAFRIAMGSKADEISNMPPHEYGERFLSFMGEKIFPSYFDEKE